jgi:hypothetical protein
MKGTIKELLEMRAQEAKERTKQRNSIRHVLLGLKIIRANFPEATCFDPEANP